MTGIACKKEISAVEPSDAIVRYYEGSSTDKVSRIEPTPDGGFLFCGITGGDSLDKDGFMLKVDGNGRQQWYNKFGGNYFDQFIHAIPTWDGGFFAVGSSNSIGAGAKDSNSFKCDYMVKTDQNGNLLWEKSIINRESDLSAAYENAAHQLIATGSVSLSNWDILTIKMNELGNTLWGYSFYPPSIPPKLANPKNYTDDGRAVSEAPDGNILVCGYMSPSTYVKEVRKYITYLMKIDGSSGLAIWFMPYAAFVREDVYVNNSWRFPVVKVLNLADGYLIGTYIELPGTKMQMQLLKTDFDGNLQWNKEYSGLGNALFYNMVANADGSILLLGTSTSQDFNAAFPEFFPNLKAMLMKVDKDGNELWTQYIGSSSNATMAKSARPRSDGGWDVAGHTCLTETGYDKMFVMQVDKNGKVVIK